MRVFELITLWLTIIIVNSMITDGQTVTSQSYAINGDFQSIQVASDIQLQLSYTNGAPVAIIETEQWVHDNRYITVSASIITGLEIQLASGIAYPPIRVHVSYRKPLTSLAMSGSGSISTKNKLVTDPGTLFSISHSGSGVVTLDLDHRSNIDVAVSGTGRLTLSGQVSGNGRYSISGTADVDAINCGMKTVLVQMSGSGAASVYGINGVEIFMSGVGSICYRGPLIRQVISGPGTIGKCNFQSTTTEKTEEYTGEYTEQYTGEYTEENSHSSSMIYTTHGSIRRFFMIFTVASLVMFIKS